MKTQLFLCVAFAIIGALFNGCATANRTAVTAAPGINSFARIHMLDAKNGWLQTDDPAGLQVLHTTDGGRDWINVTPHPSTNRIWDCQFLNPQMAWISYADGKTRLLLTTNAGKSWLPWSPLGDFDNDLHNYFLHTHSCRFFNATDGLAEMLDGGACQAVYNFFETHDGGMTWKPAFIIPPGGASPNETPGTIHTGDCDGSAISYYPSGTIVIANGDLMDETPKGVVRLNLSTNAGQSWRDLALPLPERFGDGLVQSLPPHFFDTDKAILPVFVCKWQNNGPNVYNVLIFYATKDGGNTWTRKPVVDLGSQHFDHECDFISQKNILMQHGADLYMTRDGAESWQAITLHLGAGQSVIQMDFVDAKHGWLVTSDTTGPSNSFLYRTTNGGITWSKLPLKISR
jgi:hypothetical protein